MKNKNRFQRKLQSYSEISTSLVEKKLLIKQQDRFDFKIVVAICAYNDEDFIESTLHSCLDMVDLDAIHIMDGAWVNGGLPWGW